MNLEFKGSEEYVASPELLSAVNIAMTLEKPLLLKGEPGTGKTMLAQSVADSMGMKLIIWNIKSTTKAQDGLYVYDVVQRLYDSQFGTEGVDNIEKYVHLGQVGEAFESPDRCVLLIDEIDKADLEFPNDLLWELDQMEFTIPQTGRLVKAKHRPVILITSNAEKELPDAFLRRCIFHYIDFPDEGLMRRIISVHYPRIEENLLNQTIAAFYWVRSLPAVQKKPATGELIDWIRALTYSGIDIDRIRKEIPFAGVLLKKNEDLDALTNALQREASRSRS